MSKLLTPKGKKLLKAALPHIIMFVVSVLIILTIADMITNTANSLLNMYYAGEITKETLVICACILFNSIVTTLVGILIWMRE